MATIIIEDIRKTKKNEPKVFPSLLTIDREAFGRIDDQASMLKTFWKSTNNKIVLARKSDTKAIVGYACFLEMNGGCYLMRIGVRVKCQGQGIGRKLMFHLLQKYPQHLSLDVNSDNLKAIGFYQRIGLEITGTYCTHNNVEFTQFETPEFFQTPYENTDVQLNDKFSECLKLTSGEEKKQLDVQTDSDQETQSSKSEFIDNSKLYDTFSINDRIEADITVNNDIDASQKNLQEEGGANQF